MILMEENEKISNVVLFMVISTALSTGILIALVLKIMFGISFIMGVIITCIVSGLIFYKSIKILKKKREED